MRSIIFIYFSFIVALIAQNNYSLELKKAAILLEEEKFSEAISLLENLAEDYPDSAAVFSQLCSSSIKNKLYDDAAEYAEQAVALDPNNPDYHYQLGLSYSHRYYVDQNLRRPFSYKKMRNSYQRALELNPKHEQARISLLKHYFLTPIMRGGDIKKALNHADTLKSINEFYGYFYEGYIYLTQKQYQKAESVYKFLDDKYGPHPPNPSLYNFYGYTLLHQDKNEEALVILKKHITARPDWANAYDSVGEAYRKIGEWEKALEYYKKAVELNPEFESAINAVEELEDKLYDR